jgi:hypothetical protein
MPNEVSFSANPAHGRPAAFPPPWNVEKLDACFVVTDSTGQIRSIELFGQLQIGNN